MEMPLGKNHLPWLQGRELERLRRMLEYFLLNSQIHQQRNRSFPLLRRGVRRIVQAPVGWRLRRSRYAFPWELWLARSTERLVLRRSLVTGQELPKEPTSATRADTNGRAAARPETGDHRLLTHSYHLPYDRKQVRKMQPYLPLGTLYGCVVHCDRQQSLR